MRVLCYIMIVILSVSVTDKLYAQSKNHELQAMMMLSFIRYVHWPDTDKSENLVIGIYGDSEIYRFLEGKYNNTERYGRKITIVRIDELSQVQNCHLFYLGTGKVKDFDAIMNLINERSILLVTNSEGLAHKGSGINFKNEGTKVRFELNKEAFTKSNLKVSSQLANMAILI